MSFTRYARYKASGVSWIGRVPDHWPIKRLGHHAKERREIVSDSDFRPLSVTKNGVVPQLETAAKTDDRENRRMVRSSDFVINSRSDRKGSSGISSLDGSVSLINTVLSLRDLDGRYAHYLFRSTNFQEEFYRVGKGIVADLWSTGFSEMKNIIIAIPPWEEQANIASFLDQETAKIDSLIREQQRLIELLKEKRQAVISHAVTKGLEPKVKVKDAGIQWIGMIPAHWRSGKCGRHISLLPGFAFPSGRFSVEDNHTKLLRGINIEPGQVRWNETVFWERTAGDGLNSYELMEGDIVMGLDRPIIKDGIRVARISKRDLPCLLLQRVARVRTTSELEPAYLFYLLSSSLMFEAHFRPEMSGVSVPHISPEQVRSFVIPLPPILEQLRIVERLSQEVDALQKLVAESDIAIALLEERRAALISAAVTGKIDVRNYKPAPDALTQSA